MYLCFYSLQKHSPENACSCSKKRCLCASFGTLGDLWQTMIQEKSCMCGCSFTGATIALFQNERFVSARLFLGLFFFLGGGCVCWYGETANFLYDYGHLQWSHQSDLALHTIGMTIMTACYSCSSCNFSWNVSE